MSVLIKIAGVLLAGVLLLVAGAWVYFQFFFTEPEFIADPSATLPDVQVQPAAALDLAEPHLAEHGTHSYRDDRNLRTSIVRHGDWYYVKRSNYPAKYAGWYTHGAVKVHVQTGDIDFAPTEQRERLRPFTAPTLRI